MERTETDFQSILTDLNGWGFSDYELERVTGLGRSKLTKLRTGARKQPNYNDGRLIVKLWRREKRKIEKKK